MTRPLALVPAACAALIFFAAAPSWAQDEPPAHIAVVDGSATIEREATADIAAPNTPIAPGDRIRTDAGRVEVLFADGAVLQLDERTTVDLQDSTLVRLLAGRVAVITLRDRGDLQLDTPAGSVRVGPGVDLRVALVGANGRDAMEVAVMRGQAQVWTDRGSTLVDAGYRVLAAIDEVPSQASPFNSAHWTDFDRWSQNRLSARRATVSYQYVPSVLQSYGGVFDTYGTWGYEPVYGGYVWYPRVAAGWRPYYDGRWKFYASFGWTWIGGAVWNWPTHHYGRWGLNHAGAWYWIPGPRWSPAYVHWAVSPGYVSWCPIGFDNRPVVPFWNRHAVSRARVWNAWTVLPRRSFGGGQFVNRAAIDGSRIVGRAGGSAFVTQTTAPPPVAIPRAGVATRGLSATGRSTVGVAVPRGGGYVTYQGRTMVDVPSADRNPAPSTRRPSVSAVPRTAAPAAGAAPSYRGNVPSRRGIDRRSGAEAPDAGQPRVSPRGLERRTVEPRAVPESAGPRGRAVPRAAAPRTQAPIVGRPSGAPAIPDATARQSRSRGSWSPDQVPVHRGAPVTPPVTASPAYGRGSAAPPMAVPRGHGMPSRGPSPRAMPAPAPRGGAAAPAPGGMRQAPSAGGGGRGHAVSRGGAAAAPPPASAPSSSGHSRGR